VNTPPPSESAAPADQGEVFGPVADWAGFVLRAPRRHPRLALAAFGATVLLALVAAWVLPNRYLVNASILAQRNSLMSVITGPEGYREAPTRAAREILIRRDNLVALATQTNFVQRYRATLSPGARMREWIGAKILRKPRPDDQVLDDLVDSLETRLTVSVGDEGTVNIGFEWSDPQIAFDIVQAAVQSFLEARNAADIGSVGEAIAILQVHDTRLQKEIAEGTAALDAQERALRIRSGTPARPATPVPAVKALDEELVRLEGILAARRRALADVEEYRQRRLGEMQVQLAQQLAIYAPGHPLVASTKQSIESLSSPSPQVAELKAEISRVEKEIAQRGGKPSDVRPLAAAASAVDELAATRARLLEVQDPRLEYERQQLEQMLRRRAALVEKIDRARIELDAAQAAFQERYSVITPPKMPRGPKRPLGLMLLAAGLVGGALAALAVSALSDLARGRVVERWQVERSLGLTVLAQTRRR